MKYEILSLNFIDLDNDLGSLLIYQDILESEILQAFQILIRTANQDEKKAVKAYGKIFKGLAELNSSWQDFIIEEILIQENPFSMGVQNKRVNNSLLAAVEQDLEILQKLYNCTPEVIVNKLTNQYKQGFNLIPWLQDNRKENFLHSSEKWSESIEDLIQHYRQKGTGIFARYNALKWQNSGLVGISYPDDIQLEEIVGYEEQKEILINNTERLLSGYQALNVLLYGSRGSGKSSLVKGLLRKYRERGLRLIEVAKEELQNLPQIVDRLRNRVQKFIIFVDDLSFEEDDEKFKNLKVVLEGSVTSKPDNVVIYATSNRRHLIREYFNDRPSPSQGDEVHAWDTVQEKLSFSDRFGLTLTFEPANQDKYLEIVHHLASLEGISLEREDLEFRAKQWATRHNGRSGRTARQFIDFLIGELNCQ
ncbi:MAG: hypothetical protein N5P05_001298 [Chroococcopsis gigantea SAG 12.99]|jgi:predicted AAA+ superfamily ATPase|nr:ATP-binding protein [Chlorogloea purpurea SAG 13.99]MDV2999692.1 hypothetical protein [Chroococcopsis gigantea SAG 12.99]